jgi:hypothetical protein
MKFTRTKIIASIGPNTRSLKSISQLHKAGMNVVRVNMSHASHDDLKETIKIVKKVNKLQHQQGQPTFLRISLRIEELQRIHLIHNSAGLCRVSQIELGLFSQNLHPLFQFDCHHELKTCHHV